MTNYNFETIDAVSALAIGAADTLTFPNGSASQVTVIYSPAGLPQPAWIEVDVGGRAVIFGAGLSDLSQSGGVTFADGSKLLIGGAANDMLGGSAFNDALYGGAGDDNLDGGQGDDLLQGNGGDDVIYGGGGSNMIHGGKGDDTIFVSVSGETRGSFANGNLGDDEIYGGSGADTLRGGQGDDLVAGGAGDDFLAGDLGADELFGGAGDDTLLGGAGNDIIQTGGGRDRVLGGDGDDLIIIQQSGQAVVDGEGGDDVIVSAAAGKDYLSGGDGADRFEFATVAAPTEGQDDVILDWQASDTLHFARTDANSILPLSYSEFVTDSYAHALAIANEHIAATRAIYVAAQVGTDVVVFAETDGNPADGADIAVVLQGRALSDIDLSNFV